MSKKGPTKSRKNLCIHCGREPRRGRSVYGQACITEHSRLMERNSREAWADREPAKKPLTGAHWWNRRGYRGTDKTAYYLALLEELEDGEQP